MNEKVEIAACDGDRLGGTPFRSQGYANFLAPNRSYWTSGDAYAPLPAVEALRCCSSIPPRPAN